MTQPDLFADQETTRVERARHALEAPAEFVARIRAELEATLSTVRQAESLPWPDLTRATLAELRFHSIAGWLPQAEAVSLRDAFEAEMKRLYQLEDERQSAS
ncbi:MAG: hypothetical protein ACREIR_07460 [Geminicoccaceae bacterium]